MPKNVQLPDGRVVEFPDSMSDDAIGAAIKQQQLPHGFADSFGGTSSISALLHPIDTLTGIPDSIKALAKTTHDNAVAAYQAIKNHDPEMAQKIALAVPVFGPIAKQMADQAQSGDVGGAIGTYLGAGASVPVAELTGRVTKAAARIPKATSMGVSAAKASLYPESLTVGTAEAGARNLAKALVVPTQAAGNFIKAATDEASNILGYAKRVGMPINSTVDFAKAASGAAQEVQNFYNDHVLGPHADQVIKVGDSYRGARVKGGATLGSVSARIDDINQELSPNYRKALNVQTNAANVSDSDLIAEKRALTKQLHTTLGNLHDLDPQEVASVRQRAGKLRTIADEANLSANQDTVSSGKQARGRSDIPTGIKQGAVERLFSHMAGGAETIGNRAVKRALAMIAPTDGALPTLGEPQITLPSPVIADPNGYQGQLYRSNVPIPPQSTSSALDVLFNTKRGAR